MRHCINERRWVDLMSPTLFWESGIHWKCFQWWTLVSINTLVARINVLRVLTHSFVHLDYKYICNLCHSSHFVGLYLVENPPFTSHINKLWLPSTLLLVSDFVHLAKYLSQLNKDTSQYVPFHKISSVHLIITVWPLLNSQKSFFYYT